MLLGCRDDKPLSTLWDVHIAPVGSGKCTAGTYPRARAKMLRITSYHCDGTKLVRVQVD